MAYDPRVHHRRSIRLQGYDYSRAGAYFLTVVINERVSLLTSPPAIVMAQHWWLELPRKFPVVDIDAFVVMPNHIHGIILILDSPVGADLRVGPEQAGGEHVGGEHAGSPLHADPAGSRPTLGQIVQWYKTMTTNEYLHGIKQSGWPPFQRRLWQRNYYERIIRDEAELNHIRQYVVDNPANWEQDSENPRRLK